MRCSLSFASMRASVRPEPISGMSARSLQQVRDGADVVLVAVREHDADDVVEAVADRAEVGQDQVDAGLVLLGEEHAAVDDEDLAVDLEHGHVATDLAEATDGDDPQGSRFERGWFVYFVRACALRYLFFTRWIRSSASVSCPRPSGQCAACCGVAVGAEVREVDSRNVAHEIDLVFDLRRLPLLGSDEGQPHARAPDAAEAVEDVLGRDGAGHVGHDRAHQRFELAVRSGRGVQVAGVHGVDDGAGTAWPRCWP